MEELQSQVAGLEQQLEMLKTAVRQSVPDVAEEIIGSVERLTHESRMLNGNTTECEQ